MDIAVNATTNLKLACRLFAQDLEALPSNAFDKKFGEKTRTVADIVYEVNLVNDNICMVLRGEEPFPWPDGDWIYAPEDFRTKEGVIDGFRKSSENAISTIESLSQEQLEETIETANGPRTRFQRAQFMALHLFYHSGQLNFMQTLLGDDKSHWA